MVATAGTTEVDRNLDQLLRWCCEAAPPAGARAGVFRLLVDTPVGTRERYVISTDEGCAVESAAPHVPNSTVLLSQRDLTRLALGELRGSLAFATGQVQIEGDIFFAMTWLDQLGRRPL